MNTIFLIRQRYLALASWLLLSSAQAGIPLWTFTPLTATTIEITSGSSATIQYSVTNQSRKTHTLVMTPIQGISQITTPGNCANPFTLGYQQSCTLSLEVTADALAGNVVGGPVVCQQGGGTLQCYQPSLLNSLNITLVPIFSFPMIAAGIYTSTTTQRPLLALSRDGGSNWTYPESIHSVLPPSSTDASLIGGASCRASMCIAAGFYNDLSLNSVPLLAQTTDNGATWTYPAAIYNDAMALPSFLNADLTGGASCSDSICIAAGIYRDLTTTTFPLVALSTDKGATWTYPASIYNDVPQPYGSGNLRGGASCSGSTCIAAGSYQDLTQIFPLLALTNDNGSTWTYPASIHDLLALPVTFQSGQFGKGASCSGTICIAAGFFINLAFDPEPLLAQSTDGGATWTYPASIYNLAVLPVSFSFGRLSGGASCSSSICIAAGFYMAGPTELPLLAVSTDNGTIWTYPSSITTPAFPSFGDGSFGNGGASCSGSTCIATGSYNDSVLGIGRPLLASSTDNGTTWTYPESIRSALPTSFSGFFSSASCNGSTCIAAGTYNNGLLTLPLLALSLDNGVNWTYPSSITTAIPLDFFDAGNLSGGASVSSALLPKYLRESDERNNSKL